MSRIIFLYLFLILIPKFCFSEEEKNINIEADYIAYCLDKNIISATGKIITTFEGIKINSDSLQISVNQRFLQAQGNITISKKDEETPLLQGDALTYNFRIKQGSIFKVEKLERIYFIGTDLKIVSNPLEETKQDIDLPNLSSSPLVMISRKMNVILGEKFEAWQVSFWIKGRKTCSLPYYSTALEATFRQIPLQLREITYSANSSWSVKSSLYYSQKKERLGFLNIDYYSKGQNAKQKWDLSLEQHYSLGEKNELKLLVNKLGEKNWSETLSYNHFFSKNSSFSLSNTYYNETKVSSSFYFNKRYNKSNISVSGAQDFDINSKAENSNLNFSWQALPAFVGKTNISLSQETSIQYTRQLPSFYDVWVGNYRLNLYKSTIYLSPSSFLNVSGNFAESMTSRDRQTLNLGGSLGITWFILRNNYFNITYNTSLQETTYKKVKYSSYTQRLSSYLAFGRKSWWNTRLEASYDLKEKKFEDGRTSSECKLNKLLRLNIYTSYSFLWREWNSYDANLYYNLFGEKDNRQLRGTYQGKTGDYWITLTNMI